MNIRSLLLAVALLLSTSGAFAHALWIQTSGSVKKGQTVEVKVFFGEYSDKKPDSASHWFSNLNNFKLLLTSPNGKSEILATKADILNHVASFTPDQDGIYTLSIVHTVGDVYNDGRIDYYAFTDVVVGKPKNSSNPPKNALLAFKKSKDLGYSVILKNTPFAAQKVEVINPSNEKLELTTDAKGNLDFKPNARGGYFFEAMSEEKTTGNLNGKNYSKIWHIATYYTEAV